MATQPEQQPLELTQHERDTLNAAEQIIKDRFHHTDEVLMFSWHGSWKNGFSTTYFTPNRVQHSSLWRSGSENALADKLDYALELRADEEGRAEQIKADRIAKLRAELAQLDAKPELEQAA